MSRYHRFPTKPIFVFGSNLAGRHGAGSALVAFQRHGARYGLGVGHVGNSYAIPTKDINLRTLPLDVVAHHVELFTLYAREHPEFTFNVVKIGCGLAGFTEEEIAPLFRGASPNVNLPKGWREMNGEQGS